VEEKGEMEGPEEEGEKREEESNLRGRERERVPGRRRRSGRGSRRVTIKSLGKADLFLFSAAMSLTSSSSSLKSKTFKFSFSLSELVDLGMEEMPCCVTQRRTTCAGVLLYFLLNSGKGKGRLSGRMERIKRTKVRKRTEKKRGKEEDEEE
jgi:hypothetical protein